MLAQHNIAMNEIIVTVFIWSLFLSVAAKAIDNPFGASVDAAVSTHLRNRESCSQGRSAGEPRKNWKDWEIPS